MAVAAAVFASFGVTSAQATAWHVVSSPNPAGNEMSILSSVRRVPGTTQFWAVGYGEPSTSSTNVPIVERESGGVWSLVPAAAPGHYGNVLSGVSALTTSNAWAFGTQETTATGGFRGLAEHWNGATWANSALPTGVTALNGGVAFSAGDVVAVGQGSSGALSVTWNGSGWKRAAMPTPALCIPGNTIANAVAGIPGTANRVAVGGCSSSEQHSDQGVIWTFGASGWNVVAAFPGTLNDVTPVSGTNIWAVGSSSTGALLVHWNGRTWRSVPPPPALTAPYVILSGVIRVPGTHTVWAVGSSGIGTPVAAENSGSGWSVVDMPSAPNTFGNTVFSVAASGPTDVYAVGQAEPNAGSAIFQTLVEQYR